MLDKLDNALARAENKVFVTALPWRHAVLEYYLHDVSPVYF